MMRFDKILSVIHTLNFRIKQKRINDIFFEEILSLSQIIDFFNQPRNNNKKGKNTK